MCNNWVELSSQALFPIIVATTSDFLQILITITTTTKSRMCIYIHTDDPDANTFCKKSKLTKSNNENKLLDLYLYLAFIHKFT